MRHLLPEMNISPIEAMNVRVEAVTMAAKFKYQCSLQVTAKAAMPITMLIFIVAFVTAKASSLERMSLCGSGVEPLASSEKLCNFLW